MSYKQIDKQVEKWYKTQLGTAGDNQKLKNLAHLIYDQAIEINKKVFEESIKETINENYPLIYGDGKIREYGFNKCKCGCHDIKNYEGICPVHCCDDIADEIKEGK